MKRIIMLIAFLAVIAYANDPNTPIVPPIPGVENLTVVNGNTLRITTSTDIPKRTLLRTKARLVLQRQRINEQIEKINIRLAAFN